MQLSEGGVLLQVLVKYKTMVEQLNDHTLRKCPVCAHQDTHPDSKPGNNRIDCAKCATVCV